MQREGKIFCFDKKLFSYGRPGGVHGILFCLVFVLLTENMWCVWAGIWIPITTCTLVPWEKYVCLLLMEKFQGFHEDVVRQYLNGGVNGAYLLCQEPWFSTLPHHVIKKEHQQTPFLSPSFIPFPFFYFVFHLFSLFTLKNHWPVPPLLLFCAEGRWQKELCKRAFKIPKWLWSVHKRAKECSAGQRLALAPPLRPAVMDPNGRMNVGWIWGCRGATSPPTGPTKRDGPQGYTGTPAKCLKTITTC